MAYVVSRCVCMDVSFAELKSLAEREGIDADEACRRTGCGSGCGLCAPYIRAALAIGVTELPVMGATELERLAASGKENGPAA